jgi:hypothetical protein
MPRLAQRPIVSKAALLICLAAASATGLLAPATVHAQNSRAAAALPNVSSIFDEDPDAGDWLTPVQFTQPGTAAPSPATAPQSPPIAPPRRTFTRTSFTRLARVPNMFGDSLTPTGRLSIIPNSLPPVSVDVPLAGGGRRAKISENDKTLPMDRMFFMYNHFENAFEADPNLTIPGVQRYDLDRYTLGVEKTFFDGRTSIQARIPLSSQFVFANGSADVSGGQIGNLAITLKALLFEDDDETFALGGGLTIDTPTGSDVNVSFAGTNYFIENGAVHLLPFVTALFHPDDDWFVQTSLQVDAAASGNPVIALDGFRRPSRVGILTDQTLLYADISVGRWLYRNEASDFFQGIAGIVELHYTTAMQDSDAVVFPTFGNLNRFDNPANRFDFLNLTTGVHWQVNDLTNVRVGGVFPLRSGFDRPFEAEVQVSVNRFY